VTAGTLVNAPGAVLTGAVGANGPRTLAAQLNNQSTITITSSDLTLSKGSAQHVNSGTINVSGGNFTVTQSGTSPTFTNRGTVHVASGRFWTATGGTVINADTPTSGWITGTGTVSFGSTTLANNGIVAPASSLAAGILNYTGNFSMASPAALNIELGGTGGTQYDRLAVSGTATLNGTINVSLFGGFTPSSGNTFTIMTYASQSGTPTINPPAGCFPTLGPTALTITCP
jgi:hypothetical protein